MIAIQCRLTEKNKREWSGTVGCCSVRSVFGINIREINIFENPGNALELYFYRQKTPWYICLIRQTSELNLNRNGECSGKKNLMYFTADFQKLYSLV